MRRPRQRGPSTADLIRQTRVRTLLCKYGAYEHQVSRSSCSMAESSCAVSQRKSSSSALKALAHSSWARSGKALALSENADLKVTGSQYTGQSIARDLGHMNKGLALAASQYVANVLSSGDVNTVEAQQVKEDFLHQLERDWGFTGCESLALGRIRITISRRDNDLELIRRKAELERAELEQRRLEESNRAIQRVEQSRQLQSSAVSSQVKSTQMSSSSTKVVKTRVVKTVQRVVKTVRAA